jgi:hypothetical protein
MQLDSVQNLQFENRRMKGMIKKYKNFIDNYDPDIEYSFDKTNVIREEELDNLVSSPTAAKELEDLRI